MTDNNRDKILVDGRWCGPHGIGRFASEVISRLSDVRVMRDGHPLLHPMEPMWLSARIRRERAAVYFTPGFNPPISCRIPYIFMIYDLIHLKVAEETGWSKSCYYNLHLRRAARKAFRILTVSEYSRQMILDWARLPPESVEVVGIGVGSSFAPSGKSHEPGYDYLLYVGAHKPHKNIPRMIEAFGKADIPEGVRLILTGEPCPATIRAAATLRGRIVLAGVVSENDLPMYYRGATALLFPSLYEGFGMPALEAMACGTPVVVSNVTALPEVTERAAIYVDPTATEAIAKGIELVVGDPGIGRTLRKLGLERARLFRWEAVAAKVQGVLSEALSTRQIVVH